MRSVNRKENRTLLVIFTIEGMSVSYMILVTDLKIAEAYASILPRAHNYTLVYKTTSAHRRMAYVYQYMCMCIFLT